MEQIVNEDGGNPKGNSILPAAGGSPPTAHCLGRLGFFFRSLTFGFLLLVGSYFFLEGYVRWAQVGSAERVDQTAFEAYAGDLKPEQNLLSQEIPRMAYHVRVNRDGFRGADLLPYAADRARILFLGDSFTFGQFVNDAETLPAVFAEHLARFSGENRFEIINAGRCGYTITDEMAYFKSKGRFLNPRHVVLVYYVGDEIEKAWGWQRREESLRRGRFRADSGATVFLDRFIRKSAAIYWIQEKYWGWILHRGTPPDQRTALTYFSPYEVPPSKEYHAALSAYAEDLLSLKRAVEEEGATLDLVLFPTFLQIETHPEAFSQTFLKAFAAKNGIRTLDLLPILRSSGRSVENLFFSPLNNHPRALGYETTGEELARWFTKRI